MKASFFVNICFILTGALTTLAFAPFYYHTLPFFTFAILLLGWINASEKQAAWRGLFFGIGFFGCGISWLYVSVHDYGGIPVIFSLLIMAVLVIFLSCGTALQGYLFNRLWPTPTTNKKLPYIKLLFIFPSLAVLVEWIRDWIFTGFPWLYIGTSQTSPPLSGFAPIVGEFGLSWLVFFIAGLIALSMKLSIQNKLKQALLPYLIILVIFIFGGALAQHTWTKKQGAPISTTLIQGNIPQSLKWDPNNVILSIQRYQALTDLSWRSQLIIWPENALPIPSSDATNILKRLNKQAKQHNSTLLLGLPVMQSLNHYYNSLIALGDTNASYYKQHLVPFGEYIPLVRFFPFLARWFDFPMDTFVSGPKKQPLMTLNTIKIASFVCYEIAYAQLVKEALPGANLFVTISDDAWFGDSVAAWQHLQIAQMQALISGREILFATNNGMTAFIRADGRIQAIAPRNTIYRLNGLAQAYTGSTPWAHWGNSPFIILSFLILLSCFLARFTSH